MNSRSMGDLNKIYEFSENIMRSRLHIFFMMFKEQNRGTTVNKRRSIRIENLIVRVNRLTLMRHDEIMRVYSNANLHRNMSPIRRRRRHRRHRSTKSLPPKKSSRQQRPVTASHAHRLSHSSRSRSVTTNQQTSSSSTSPPLESVTTPEPSPPPRSRSITPNQPSSTSFKPRPLSPIAPLKVTQIIVEPDSAVIEMVPTDVDEGEEEEEEDDSIYPEGVTDLRPYKTVARFRKALGKSTNFQLQPLLVGDDSAETLVLGLESFAEQHGCDLTFTNEDQQFDKSIYRAACGIADLGSIHLLATDSLLTANFQFEIDLDYDDEFAQSEENIEKFVLNFCEAISKVLLCDNSNVRVFSINKLAKKTGRSNVNFGLTTSNPKRTERLAHNLQVHLSLLLSHSFISLDLKNIHSRIKLDKMIFIVILNFISVLQLESVKV
jgi:hypothetical protein